VVGIICVYEDDELLMMTARGKIQRVAVKEIRITGRNTHGVKIMSLDEEDSLAAIARVPPEERAEGEESAPEVST
jgi:DNA gyrase subunit A